MMPDEPPLAVPGSRLATAYHEAGHAVIARELHIRVKRVEVGEDETSAGRVRHTGVGSAFDDYSPTSRDRSRAERLIMLGWAGPLAETKATGDYDPIGAGLVPNDVVGRTDDAFEIAAVGDMGNIWDFADVVCGGSTPQAEAYINWLRIRTSELLDREDLWCQVRSVAVALDEHGQLSGRAFHALCRQALTALRAEWREHHQVIREPSTKPRLGRVP